MRVGKIYVTAKSSSTGRNRTHFEKTKYVESRPEGLRESRRNSPSTWNERTARLREARTERRAMYRLLTGKDVTPS